MHENGQYIQFLRNKKPYRLQIVNFILHQEVLPGLNFKDVKKKCYKSIQEKCLAKVKNYLKKILSTEHKDIYPYGTE